MGFIETQMCRLGQVCIMEGKRFGWPLARVVAELRPGPSSARSFTRPRLSRHERACRGMHPKAGQDEFSLGVTFFFQLQHLPSLNPILQFRYPSETFSTIDALLSPLSLQTHLSHAIANHGGQSNKVRSGGTPYGARCGKFGNSTRDPHKSLPTTAQGLLVVDGHP